MFHVPQTSIEHHTDPLICRVVLLATTNNTKPTEYQYHCTAKRFLVYNFHHCIYHYSSFLICNSIKSHPVAFSKTSDNCTRVHSRCKWTVKVIEKHHRHTVKSIYIMQCNYIIISLMPNMQRSVGKHIRRCVAKKRVSPTKSQSMAQFAVTSLRLCIQWHYETMQQAKVFVQCIHQCCHIIRWIADNIQQLITTLSQITAHAHKIEVLLMMHYTSTSHYKNLHKFADCNW